MSDYDRGVEKENLYLRRDVPEIRTPFDPRQVDIATKVMVISNVVARLDKDEIELNPDFQRSMNLWDEQKQSRLIESLLIRIPLPTFYFDMPDEDHLIVVDGVQRLCAIKNFMGVQKENAKRLRLTGLEYLKQYNGYTYDELPSNLQRRLNEQEIQTYIIKAGTPDNVRNSIFERINTGGLTLTSAEIKNSVYRGRASDFVRKLAESPEFRKATCYKVKSDRMLDREFVNRFLAFFMLGESEYCENLEDYLTKVLEKIKNDENVDLDKIEAAFKKAAVAAYELFGDRAFKRPTIAKNGRERYGKINKPLYEAIMVQLAKLSDKEMERLLSQKALFLQSYKNCFNDDEFVSSIRDGTARIQNVKIRHEKMKVLFNEYGK